MRSLREQVTRIAPSDATVLILGENGTGKELIARQLHSDSRRCANPFVVLDCAALPEGLVEAELFGAKKHAYTGLMEDRQGLFERAQGGTLFLDELAELPLSQQAKLLRAIQERRIAPLGGGAEVEVDVRFVAATNCDLERAVAEQRFRQDLYYRINVIKISVPPLRERREDIADLVAHFIKEECSARNLDPLPLHPDCIEALQAFEWPGNVRQLQNAVVRSIVLADPRATTYRIIVDGAVPLRTDSQRRRRRSPRSYATGVPKAIDWLPEVLVAIAKGDRVLTGLQDLLGAAADHLAVSRGGEAPSRGTLNDRLQDLARSIESNTLDLTMRRAFEATLTGMIGRRSPGQVLLSGLSQVKTSESRAFKRFVENCLVVAEGSKHSPTPGPLDPEDGTNALCDASETEYRAGRMTMALNLAKQARAANPGSARAELMYWRAALRHGLTRDLLVECGSSTNALRILRAEAHRYLREYDQAQRELASCDHASLVGVVGNKYWFEVVNLRLLQLQDGVEMDGLEATPVAEELAQCFALLAEPLAGAKFFTLTLRFFVGALLDEAAPQPIERLSWQALASLGQRISERELQGSAWVYVLFWHGIDQRWDAAEFRVRGLTLLRDRPRALQIGSGFLESVRARLALLRSVLRLHHLEEVHEEVLYEWGKFAKLSLDQE